MSGTFLTAEWRNLALFNYAVDPAVLAPFVPAGTELDRWNDRCYVSLVGFLFKNTRLKGIPIPFHRTFEEVNLRFYVKRTEGGVVKRGVAFIQEIVPRPALTLVARTLYSEPYRTCPMEHVHRVRPDANDLFVSYAWRSAGARHVIKVVGRLEPEEIAVGSAAEFITEHYWGYTRMDPRRTNAYEVKHPRWRVHPVLHQAVNVDFGAVYGQRFAFLNGQAPDSVMLAEGSAITVMGGGKLRL